MKRALYIISYLLLIFLFPFLHASVESATLEVEWKNNLLTVNAKEAQLSDVLKNISRNAGIDIIGMEILDEPCTVHFSNLSLQKSFKKLLSHKNYMMLEALSQKGDILPIQIFIVENGAMPPEKAFTNDNSDLNNSDPGIRLARIQELISLNPDQIDSILYSATQDSDPSIRELAYIHLIEKGDNRVSSILQNDANSKDIDIRKVALSVIGRLSTLDALEALKLATGDDNVDIRYTAIQQLSQMQSPEGIAIIKERLSHPDPEIRIMAIEAMSSQGEKLAFEAASLMLEDNNEMVRNTAEQIKQDLKFANR